VKISVIIPWRSHPSRVPAFEKVVELYQINFPDFEIIVSDSSQEDFNLSEARNLGARKAIESGADLVIFNDADFFVDPSTLKKAIAYAVKNNEIAAPYTRYFQHKNAKETSVFLRKIKYDLKLGKEFSPPTLSYSDTLPRRLWPCSGSIVVPINIFKELGGFEEKIKGWGPEDTMFHRSYFEKYGKLFGYIFGSAHSTFNDPTYRGDRPENQYFKDLVDFKDKRG
jgi:predicted glycosyltransferase involved in capsule biosynthesis